MSEEAPLVNTTLASTSGLISEQQVKDLPLNGRSFDNLLVLNVSTSNPSSNVNNGAWTAFSVAGKRMETNRYLLNGLDWIGQNGTGQFITPMGTAGSCWEWMRCVNSTFFRTAMARNTANGRVDRSAW